MFARAGIYMFEGSSPQWLIDIYNTFVQTGDMAMNFATILTYILLLVLATVLWQRGTAISKVVSVFVLVTLSLGATLFFVFPNASLSFSYFTSSIFLVILALAYYWKNGGAPRMVLTLGPLLIMLLASYWYKIVPLAYQLGWTWLNTSFNALQLSEGMFLLFLFSLPLTVGLSRNYKILAGSMIFPLLLVLIHLVNPDMVPLIAIWSFGIVMYLPLWIYILALWSAATAILTLLVRGHLLPAFALVILLGSHRMLNLIYFNNLVLIALLIVVIMSWPVSPFSRQWSLWRRSSL